MMQNFKTITSAMMMTAGLGTRLQPFTNFCTKALMPVMGIPIAQFTLDTFKHAGVKKVVSNVHHRFDETKAQLLNLEFHDNGSLLISDESRCLLGSAGGIARALPLLTSESEERFFLMNADIMSDIDLKKLSEHHFKLKSQWGVNITLAICNRNTTGQKYTEFLINPDTHLIEGLSAASSNTPFYIGAAVIESEIIKNLSSHQPSEFVEQILLPAIHNKKAGAYITESEWMDIGTPQLLLDTHIKLIKKLEKDHFKSPISKLWKKRIEKKNKKLSHQIWTNQSVHEKALSFNKSQWKGPIYLDQNMSDELPNKIGPNVAIYGECKNVFPHFNNELSNGILFKEHWVSV